MPARAAETVGGDLQRFQSASAPFGGFATPSSDALPVGGWAAGLHLDYSRNALVLLRNGERLASTVQNNFSAHLQGAVGLASWFELGAGALLVPYQDGYDPRFALPSFAVGDLRILPKFLVFEQWRDGISASITPAFTLPLGGAPALAGDSFLTFAPEVGVSRRWSAWFLAGSLVLRVRRDVELFEGAPIGKEFGLRLAGGERISDTVEALVELDGGFALTGLKGSPLEARAGVRWRQSDSWVFDAGLGAGVLAAPGIPDLRVIVGATYGSPLTPRSNDACLRVAEGARPQLTRAAGRDTDGDGLDDACDLCPSEAEPKDARFDGDGCPVRDRDRDGVLDAADQCPDVPGNTASGCPDRDLDGVLDAKDACPDVPGNDPAGCPDRDLDGVLDAADQCPDVPGVAPHGCPDEDRDGVFDAKDACPAAAGAPPTGCPDQDGDGLFDHQDKCPAQAEDKDAFEDEDGCPDEDDDKDGVADTADQCRLEPEDKDAFEDEDGCPEADNDKDGVLDPADQCPTEPETINGVTDEDGCPDKGRSLVVMKTEKIEILDKVYFDTGKDTIQKRSYGLLKQVALTIKAHAELERIRVEGHTDDVGDDDDNLDLSQRRADAVKRFLENEGVQGARLVPAGYGETRPMKPNTNAKNRADNRRVEFVILDAEEGGAAQ